MGSILSSLFGKKWNRYEEIPEETMKYLEGLKKKYPKDVTIWSEKSVNSSPEVIKKDLISQGSTPLVSIYYDPKSGINLFTIWYDSKEKSYVYRDNNGPFGWGTKKNLKDALKVVLEAAEMFGFGNSIRLFSKKDPEDVTIRLGNINNKKRLGDLSDKQLKNIAAWNHKSPKAKKNVRINNAITIGSTTGLGAIVGSSSVKGSLKGSLVGAGIGGGISYGGHLLHKHQAKAAEEVLKKRGHKPLPKVVKTTEEE